MFNQIPNASIAQRNLQIIHKYHNSGLLFGTLRNDYRSMKNQSVTCHWHEDLEFQLVLEGDLDFNLNGTLMKLHAGDCIFVNGNTLHQSFQKQGSPAAVSLITAFHPQIFHQILGEDLYHSYFETFLQHTNGFLIDHTLPCGAKIIKLLQELASLDKMQSGYELLYLRQLFSIWYETIQHMKETLDMSHTPDLQKSNSIAVKRMLAYIYEHYDQKIEIKDLLEDANLSRSECFRCFKRYIGISPVEYINNYRLAKSVLLLANTDMNILEISLACGFSSSSYYGKLFKQHYEVSPLAYRKHARSPGTNIS